MFTLTDKTLLDRAARMINGQARGLRVLHEANGWASTEAGRKAKQEYDRLLRDERDMRSLGKRLCAHFDVHAVRGGVVMEAASTVLGTAGPIGSVMTATEALANLPAALMANAPRQDTAEVGDPLNALSPEARADYLSNLGPGSTRDFSGLKFDVSRETPAGNPLLRTTPGNVTVQAPQVTGEQDVGF